MKVLLLTLVAVLYCQAAWSAQDLQGAEVPIDRQEVGLPVVSDDGVVLSYGELSYALSKTDEGMRRSAADDLATRFELLNIFMVNKKMARDAQAMTPDSAGELYWELQSKRLMLERQYALDAYLASQEKPNFSALAEERYRTQKDKYARVPEKRLVSHILLQCSEDCDRAERFQEMGVIREKALAGENFAELAKDYSEDPGSKDRGGRLNDWIEPNMKVELVREFLNASLKLNNEGDLSDIVSTSYGFHVIRLDQLEPAHYLAFDQARARIERALEAEWKKLALKSYQATLQLSDETKIDGKVIEELFAPYSQKRKSSE